MLSLPTKVENITQWLCANKLTPNVNKTKYMIVANKNKLEHLQPVTIEMKTNHLSLILRECTLVRAKI